MDNWQKLSSVLDRLLDRIKEPDNPVMIEDVLKQVERQNKQYYSE